MMTAAITVDCDSEAETLAVARRLAPLMRVGDVVLLSGELGSGKTTFVKGLAEGLGVERAVASPSFIIARTYRDGLMPLTHADVYRIASLAEVDDLDLLEQAADGVLVVEWGRAVANAMPADHLAVEFEVTGPDTRRLRLVAKGSWNDRRLVEVLG